MVIGRFLIGLVGVFDAAAGVALLLAPQWFYDTVGPRYGRQTWEEFLGLPQER